MFCNLHLAAFALITGSGGKVLLKLRRDIPLWDLPGGQAEETDFQNGIWLPEVTCQREVLEETGCRVKIDRVFGYFYTGAIAHDIPSISVIFEGQLLDTTLSCNAEAKAFGWFTFSEIPKNTFNLHTDILRQFQNGEVDRWDLRDMVAYYKDRYLA